MILVIGEALVDIIDRGDGTHEAYPGGSPANVAVGLGRLDHDVQLLTSIGADAHGALIVEHLRDAGVALAGRPSAETTTSTAAARLDSGGAASYTFDIDWDIDVPPRLHEPAVVHTGSIAAALQPGAATVESLLETYAPRAMITFDPNIRPALMGDADVVRPRIERLIDLCDVVKASDEDIAWLYPGRDHDDVVKAWLETRPSVVFVTKGGDGSTAHTSAGSITVPPAKAVIVDTVGAGDAFMAGIIDGLGREHLLGASQRQGLHTIDLETVERIARHASLVSGLTVARSGAVPPSTGEVLAAEGA